MLSGRRVCVVMPAYDAARTLRRTVAELDRAVVDDVLLVDGASGLARSVRHGLGVLATALEFRAARLGLPRSPRFPRR